MAYADYDFYRNVYWGNAIFEEDFLRLSEQASDYIRAATSGISDHVDGRPLEAVKKCTCAVADVLLDESIITANAFSREQAVSSETVGGWSKSYRVASISAAETAYLSSRKQDALRLYLETLPAFAPVFKVRSFSCFHRAE